MALKNKIHFDIDTLERITDTQGQAINTLEGQASTADNHIDRTDNPHQVTATQIGAVTQGELENALTQLVEDLDWKEMVPTFADLAIEYPEPEEGWTASVAADNITYRYNGTEWVPILGALSPLATANNNGLLAKEDFSKLAGIAAGAQPNQNAGEVPFDNINIDLTSTSVQGAIEELDLKKLNATALATTLALYPTDVPADILSPSFRMVTSIDDPDYPVEAVNINTPAITANDLLVGQVVSDPGVIIGNPGVINISTIGQIRKISGNVNQRARFFYKVYRWDGTSETLDAAPIATSEKTQVVNSTSFEEFFAFAILNNGVFGPLDRIVVRYFADVDGNPGAVFQFQFGGTNPVRTLLPVPVEVIPAPDASKIIVDTAVFNSRLSGNDNTVQQALETLDQHAHDETYFTQDELRPQIADTEPPFDLFDDLDSPGVLDNRYLKTNAVGNSVQPFNANTVVDANYNNFNPNGTYANLRARRTTKGDVGLGSVEDYGIASKTEAEAGSVNNKYMTPLRTKEAILELSPPTDLSGVEGRLDVIEGTGTGSIAKSLADAKDYTDAEILSAQLNLGNNYSVATIAERNALQNLAVGDIVFVADDGDTKWAQYKVTALDPLAFLKVMDEDIFLNAVSAADVKAAYESNADTNAFTDAEKTKLTNIEPNAQVNPSAADIKAAYESNPDTNALTDNLVTIINNNNIDIGFIGQGLNNLSNTVDSNTNRIVALEQMPPGGGTPGEGIGVQDYTFTVPTTDWNAGSAPGSFVNVITFDPFAVGSSTENYPLNFENNFVFFGEPNMSGQTMTFSSNSTTGPITVTRNAESGGGGFNERFVGGLLRVQETEEQWPIPHYIITEVVDEFTIVVYYQQGPSQFVTLQNLTHNFRLGPTGIEFIFMLMNTTGPNPEDPRLVQIGSFEDQTQQFYSAAGSVHVGPAFGVFTIPQSATEITGFNELHPQLNEGIRFYSIMIDDDVFIATSEGVRRIATRNQSGETFFNAAQAFGDEDFQSIGFPPLEIGAMVAMNFGPLVNRAFPGDWTAATSFPSIENKSIIRFMYGLEVVNNNERAASTGVSVIFETLEGANVVLATDQIFLDINITQNNFANAAAIEEAWSNVKAVPVAAPNTLVVVSTEIPEVEIPVKMGVFR